MRTFKNTIFVIIAIFIFSTTVFSQQDSGIITKQYLGALGVIAYDTSANTSQFVSFRGGIEAKMNFIGLELTSRAVFISTSQPKTIGFSHFWATRRFDNISLSAGYLAHPMCEIGRPHPVTSGGHFEPPSKSIIPGSTTGLRLDGNFGKLTIKTGVHYLSEEKKPEYGIGFIQKFSDEINVGLAGSFVGTDQYGLLANINHPLFNAQGYYESKENTSMFFEVISVICPYWTLNYNHAQEQVINSEVGFTKAFTTPISGIPFTTLIGAGYEFKTKTTALYVFVHF